MKKWFYGYTEVMQFFVSSMKYNHSPPQPSGDVPKTRSLDRRNVEPIVLTKWRHSAHVQDPADKV